MNRNYNSVHEAYINSLNDLNSNGHLVKSIKDSSSIGSYFGTKERDFIEMTGVSFVLKDSRNRLIYSDSRKLSLGFSIANFLWLLSGRNDVQTIKFYNKHGDAFSKNGTYYEAAFGERIFGKLNLWDFAKDILIRDENTRRALIPIFIPRDLATLPLDTPCASSIQIMIRKGKVDFFLHMRSQSVAMVFPYDIFLFTMLHELVSLLLNLPLGNFNYYCNSFHYYTDENDMVNNILSGHQIEPVPMHEMSLIDNNTIAQILGIEKKMRSYTIKGKPIPNNMLTMLPEYWKDLFEVVYRKICNDHNIDSQFNNPSILNNKHLFA